MNKFTVSLSNFEYSGPGHYTIIDSDLTHDLFIKKGGNQLIVFGQGAVDKGKPQPNFQRISWVDSLDDTIIICTDPEVNRTHLSLAWFQTKGKTNYFYRFSILLKSLLIKLECNETPPIFYGSSAGGFTSLMMSAYFENSWAVVNNPQTDWTKFHTSKVLDVINTIYSYSDIQEYKENNAYKFSPVSLYKANNRLPNIIYIQNRCDQFHYKEHYLPFSSAINELAPRNKMLTFFYDNPKEGHNPIDKEETLVFISIAKFYLGR